MLSFYSSSTGVVNSRKAMAECLENALVGQGSLDCDLLVIYATIGHDFSQLLEEAQLLAPSGTVVGCTSAGVVGGEGPNESMRALAIMAIKSDGENEFAVSYCDNIRGYNSYEKAEQMAKELYAKNSNTNMVLFLASGIDIAADKAMKGVEAVFGSSVGIFGGTSSDNAKALTSFQFVDGNVLERGAVLVGFADSSLEVMMGVHHGSVPIGMPMTVTRSEANRVYELDGQPAWPYLMGKLDLPKETHPGSVIPIAGLGEILPDSLHDEYGNKHILRIIAKVDENFESFYMPVDCPEGTQLWMTRRDEDRIFNGLDDLMENMKQRTSSGELVAVFHTDCVARGRLLFNKILKEEIVSRTQIPLVGDRNIPWLGMYGFGEFCMLGGRNFFHNYSTCIYAIVRK